MLGQQATGRLRSLCLQCSQDAALVARLRRFLGWLAVATTVLMAVVLLQGTLVTNTGSQAGCGDTWPLCHGTLVPELSGVAGAATLIEFSHRAVVPIVSTLIIVLAVGILLVWPRRLEAKILAPGMILFLFMQAVLGGLAVMYPTSAEVLALHFGISLLSFASVLLTAAFVLETGRIEHLRNVALARGMQWLIWITFAFTYVQVYLGAYVRHTGSSLACLDWPLCNGSLVPRSGYGVQAQYDHRLGALLLTLLVAALLWRAYRVRRQRPDLFAGSAAAMVLILLQGVSGGVVVLSRLAIPATLLHSFLVTLMFGALSYLCYQSLPLPRAAFLPDPGRAAGFPHSGRVQSGGAQPTPR